MSEASYESLLTQGVKNALAEDLTPDQIRILIELVIEEEFTPIQVEVGGQYLINGERALVTQISAPTHQLSTPWVRVPKVTYKKLDESTPTSGIYGATYGYEHIKEVDDGVQAHPTGLPA